MWFVVLFSGMLSSILCATPLMFGVPNRIGRIDPLASMDVQTKQSLLLIFENLVQTNSQQELEPVLAETWTIAEDRKSILFSLRKDHHFSDGSPVTSTQVRQSMERLCSTGSYGAIDLAGLEGCQTGHPKMEVLGPQSIRFHINVHPTLFLFQLSSSRAVITNEKGLGSGPYVLNQTSPEEVRFIPNKHYHALQRVANDGIRLHHIDEDTFGQALRSLNPDGTIMYRVSATAATQDERFRIIEEPPGITLMLILNNQRFPFNDRRVRQAILAGLYESKIAECARGVRKAYGIIPVGLGGSLAPIAPKHLPIVSLQELTKAIPKLKQAVHVTLHRHIGRKDTCEENEVKRVLKRLNIIAEFKYHADYATLWPKYLDHSIDGFLELFVFRRREAFSILNFFLSKNKENFPNVHDATLDALISESMSVPSPTARFAAYREANQYILKHALAVPIHYVAHSNFIHRCILGVPSDFDFSPFQKLMLLSRKPGCL